MIVHSILHQGTVAYPKEITLSLADLPEIIAISGPNGAGKTTLLDLIPGATHLAFPYRSGPLHRHFAAPGFIEMIWGEDGQDYRSRITVDPNAEKVEANLYLHPKPAGNVGHKAGPLQKHYAAEMERLVGSLDAMLAYMYAVQRGIQKKGTGSFLELDKSERKSVFSELMDLGRFERRHETALRFANEGDKDLAVIRIRVDGLSERMAGRQPLESRISTEERRLTDARRRLEDAGAEHDRAVQARAEAKEALAALEPKAVRRAMVDDEIKTLETRRADTEKRLTNNRAILEREAEIRTAVARNEAITDEIAKIDALTPERTRLLGEVDAFEARVRNLEKQQKADTGVLAKETEVVEAEQQTTVLLARLEAIDGEIDRATAAYQDAVKAFHTSQLHARTLETLRGNHARITQDAAIVDTVPCNASAPYDGCPFLTNALVAREALPALNQEIEVLAKQPAVAEPDDPLPVLRKDRTAIKARIDGLAATVKLRSALDGARERLATTIAQLTEQRTGMETTNKALDEITKRVLPLSALKEEQAALVGDVARINHLIQATARIEELAQQLAQVTEDLDRLCIERNDLKAALAIQVDLETAIKTAEADIKAAIEARQRVENEIVEAERTIAGLRSQLEALAAAEQELAAVQATMEPQIVTIADWQLLAKACGPNGIPALMIDQALPEISRNASDLLRECFEDSRYAIRLFTQRESADGSKLLEDLGVEITRAGQTVPVDVLCGGELAVVSEAVCIGIAMYKAARTGHRVLTILRDEVTAALRADMAKRYVRLLRVATKAAGFRSVLFVTHQPACLNDADARITVDNGTLTIG